MNPELKEFVEKNITTFEQLRISDLYWDFSRQTSLSPSTLTQLLEDTGIDPLAHITVVPTSYSERNMSLEHISIPDNIEKISGLAFTGCLYLQSVHIPSSVKRIGREAFANCVGLTDVRIDNGCEILFFDVFKNCTSLKSIEIPDSLTSIGTGVFNGCKLLERISLPAGLKCLEHYLFHDCPSLTTIEFRGLSSQWEELPKHTNWIADKSPMLTVKCIDNRTIKYRCGERMFY